MGTYAQLPEATGIIAAEAVDQGSGHYVRPIVIGVATGVSVWLITKLLERWLGLGAKK